MPFLTDLNATKLRAGPKRGRAVWRLNAPLVFESRKLKQTFTVEAGTETDFASVPRLPLVYLLAGDTAHEAAALHDELYRSGIVPRDVADALFDEAMEDTGEPGWRRNLMYAAVRAFGGGFYREQEQKRAEIWDTYVG